MSFGKKHLLIALGVLAPVLAHADNVLHPGTPVLDRPTLITLGVQLPISGDDNYNATVTMQYRVQGTTTWQTAQPLYRVHPNTIYSYSITPQFAGSIFDLRPNTTYEIELHAVDPDGPVDQTFSLTGTTRAVPGDPASPRVVNVTDTASLQAAFSSAQPGDVITLANGFYSGQFGISASGTAANPIVIRGASQAGVVLDANNCSSCNVLEVYGSYVHVEQLTIQNAQRALRFYNTTTANVVRGVLIQNVIMGIAGYIGSNQTDFYIADNILQGRLQWPLVYSSDGGAESEYTGLAVTGNGMVVAHNRISGFGDALRNEENGARSLDFYGNDVLWTYDNDIELDESEGNVRCMRNRFTNVWDSISVQPVYGGPAYVFRNIVVNAADEQVKFHALGVSSGTFPEPNGVFVYHNTFVSPYTDLQVQTPYASHHFALENNLFVAPAVLPGHTVNWDAPIDDGKFDYNGYFPDGSFLFYWAATGYATYPNFAAMQSAGVEVHGRLLTGQVFANGFTAPTNYTTLVAPTDVTPASPGPAIDAGLVLPNLNDGYTGSAPDLGAVEAGCPTPVYGPRPAGMDETNEPLGCVPSASTPAPGTTSTSTATIAINAGGSAYTSAAGQAWTADTDYSAGWTYSTGSAIGNTSDPTVYQTERYGTSFGYTIPVSPGSYNVTLKFAELTTFYSGGRVFNVSINGNTVLANFDIYSQVGGLAALDETFTVSAGSQIAIQFTGSSGNAVICGIAIAPSSQTTTQSTASSPTSFPAGSILVNSGGGAYTSSAGQAWSGDTDYSGGWTYGTSSPINNTSDPTLYQTERYGTSFGYTIPVSPGSYNVTLKFAELTTFYSGGRVFNVSINGSTVLTNFDIYSQVGGLAALDETFTVSAGSQIAIQFTGVSGNAVVNAIAISPAGQSSTTSLAAVFATNSGGGAYTSSTGQAWSGDTDYSGGWTYSTGSAIGNTSDPTLYQTERYGTSFGYAIPVSPGNYNVTLKFAELTTFYSGGRVFNVAINGNTVLTNFDIFAQAGGLTALDKTFTVSAGSQIAIQFTGVSGNAVVNAIAISPAGQSSATSAAAVFATNSGGGSYTGSTGQAWSGDTDYSGGWTYGTSSSISNTSDPTLYQTERYGTSFGYTIPVSPGNYNVTLKFTELTTFYSGGRVFNVSINGNTVLTDFDIYSQVGGLAALDKTFTVSAGSQIAIQFTGMSGNAVVNAIQITPAQ